MIFFFDSLPERWRSEFHAGLDGVRVLRDGHVRIFVFVVDDPTLAFGHDLVAEFFSGNLVSPFAEGAFGEFLDVAFVHQRHALASGLERMLNGHANEALCAGH
jgi:hypothetical protein